MTRYDKRTEYNKNLKNTLKNKFKMLNWKVYADQPNTNGNYMFGSDVIFVECNPKRDTLVASQEMYKAKKYIELLKENCPFKIITQH